MISARPRSDPAVPVGWRVLRPIFIAGERVEVGAVVLLTRAVGTELASAGKLVLAAPDVVAAEPVAEPPVKRSPKPAREAAA